MQLFVPSGTAGNQIALRTHLTQPPHSVLCDHRAHVVTSEAGGLASLSQAMVQPVVPSNGVYLTVEDGELRYMLPLPICMTDCFFLGVSFVCGLSVKRAAVLEENIHYAPTRVISLENTLGGTILPLEEVIRIKEYATANGLKMHLVSHL